MELLDPSRTNGLQFDTLIFDEYYGGKPDFLKGLDEREQPFLAEVPVSFRVLRGCAVSISEIGALLYQACDRKEGRTHGCGRGSSVWVCGLPRR